MAEEIGLNSIKLKYISIEEARSMTGLRLILGAYAVPGPWREACKGIFYVKKISYVPVASAGKDGSDRELREWTAQVSAPVAVWNDERPRSTWIEQLYLAERLAPTPPLIPASIADRVVMVGYSNEICGENGFAWSKRLTMIHSMLSNPKVDEANRKFWIYMGNKYGYSPAAAEAAPARMAEVLRHLGTRVEQQRTKGSEAVSKLKKCQEKCDFHGWKRAVANEIHSTLRWEVCHASRIAPMSLMPTGAGSSP